MKSGDKKSLVHENICHLPPHSQKRHTNKHICSWNKIEGLVINKHLSLWSVYFYKNAKTIQWGKIVFSTNSAGTNGCQHAKIVYVENPRAKISKVARQPHLVVSFCVLAVAIFAIHWQSL